MPRDLRPRRAPARPGRQAEPGRLLAALRAWVPAWLRAARIVRSPALLLALVLLGASVPTVQATEATRGAPTGPGVPVASASPSASKRPPALTAPAPLLLQARRPDLDPWPQVRSRVLRDGEAPLDPRSVAASADGFGVPAVPQGAFGQQTGSVWLRLALQRADDGADDWWLLVDYPPLDQLRLWTWCGDQLVQQAVLGDHLPASLRHGALRAHQAPLKLPAATDCVLVLQARSEGATTLPLRLLRSDALAQAEARHQMLQGLFFGLGLAAVVYALLRAWAGRDGLYGWYAAAASTDLVYLASYHGLAGQHLWPGLPWLLVHGTPLLGMAIVATGAPFIARALQLQQHLPLGHHAMRATAGAAVLAAITLVAGWMPYRVAAVAAALTGVALLVIALPLTWRRWRKRDPSAPWLLGGWLAYGSGLAATTAVQLGLLPAHPVFAHAMQAGSLGQLAAWAMVLRLHASHRAEAARAAQREADRLDGLAHSDALTGLGNRRHLQRRLQALLGALRPPQQLAAYALDLDGFKPVNDRHGHEAGDLLLQQLAERLRAQARHDDVLVRVGGDEFVVLVPGVADPVQARRFGQRLLAICAEPFVLPEGSVRLGVTVGVALAPTDAQQPDALLRLADQALYAGKLRGRNLVVCHGDVGTDDTEATAKAATAAEARAGTADMPADTPSDTSPNPPSRPVAAAAD